MTFTTAVVDLHGVNQTLRVEKPFGGKNIDVLCDLFADSIETGKRDPRLPLMRDSLLLHPNMHGNSSKTHICTIYRLSVICVRLNKSGNEEKYEKWIWIATW